MRELIRTNDPVLLNYVELLLKNAGIETMIADQNMSVMEGSIGILPRRVLVSEDDFSDACRLLNEADLGHWIRPDDKQ